jgi:hypothetical protein
MKKPTRKEIIKKWNSTGFLDGFIEMDKNSKITELFEPNLTQKVYTKTIPNPDFNIKDLEHINMIDNLNLIKPLLNFEKDGDFYMLYVFKRKKDQPEGERDNHQSVRTIKTYCVDSVEYLEKRYDEIKTLCEVFKARAYIHIQKQNHFDVGMEMIKSIVDRVQSGQSNQKNVFDSVVGSLKTNEKRWIVDIDTKDKQELKNIQITINRCRPEGAKIEAVIPTKSGYHLITKKFDVIEFKKNYTEIDIQRKNPTLLYYPNSLEN